MTRAMFTDLYAYTMAAAHARAGQSDRLVTCEMFTRRLPRNRRFMVVAGMRDILEALASWQPSEGDLAYLRSLPQLSGLLTGEVLERFRRIRFRGDAWAMPDGTVFFPDEPVLRITAPVVEAQLVETFVLSVFNHGASIASKAARVVLAAAGKPVLEFGMRRVHPDASVTASRIAYESGLRGTSNVAAAQRYDLPVTGTMAHAYIMVHDTEEEAFRSFVAAFPEKPILLVDTYDTLQGVHRAAEIAGSRLGGVRLDSGDLAELARGARKILDGRGLSHVKIIASGDLDENKIAALQASGAPIDTFAVGTELAASADAPTLGAVYKVVHDHGAGRDVAKFSASKGTLAGRHQVFRRHDAQGRLAGDVIGMDGERLDGTVPLLVPVMKEGALVGPLESSAVVRARTEAQLAALPERLRGIAQEPFEPYAVTASAAVKEATERARTRHRGA